MLYCGRPPTIAVPNSAGAATCRAPSLTTRMLEVKENAELRLTPMWCSSLTSFEQDLTPRPPPGLVKCCILNAMLHLTANY
jgi:hypothetical protein